MPGQFEFFSDFWKFYNLTKPLCLNFLKPYIYIYDLRSTKVKKMFCNIIFYAADSAAEGSTSQQAQDIDPMLVKCWASIADGWSTLNQHCGNVSCLLD